MKNRKLFIIGIAIVFIFIIAGMLTNYIDSGKVTTNHEPKFCIKTISNDGSKVTYWGLGYKVIRYVGVSPNEPYENNIGAKMGSWFMKYELPKVENIQIDYEGQTVNITNIKDIGIIENILLNSKYNNEICDGINTHKITLNNEIYYIKESCKEIQKGEKQAKISDEDLETINKIISSKIYTKQNKENAEETVFDAEIKRINTYNGITTILVKGFETNEINYRGEFDFSIDDDTKILWVEPNSIKSSYTELDLSKLKENQKVSITSTGEVLESSPAQLTKVTKVIVLNDEL